MAATTLAALKKDVAKLRQLVDKNKQLNEADKLFETIKVRKRTSAR